MKKFENEKPLVRKEVQLEKFPGKGGWTYARVPEIPLVTSNPFGWRKVKGSIDGIEIKQYHLMPMGNGELFLPVKAAIRKKIKKEAGDWIKVILYADTDPLEIPPDFRLCLKDDPQAWKHFQSFTEQEQKAYIRWIYEVKTERLQTERMAAAINRIARGEKF